MTFHYVGLKNIEGREYPFAVSANSFREAYEVVRNTDNNTAIKLAIRLAENIAYATEGEPSEKIYR